MTSAGISIVSLRNEGFQTFCLCLTTRRHLGFTEKLRNSPSRQMFANSSWGNAATAFSLSYSRIRLRNTKPAQSLRRTFSERNSRKKNRSDNKMAAPKASVHSVRNRLCYHFCLYQTNESCSQSISRRRMLLRRFNHSCLRVTAPNATEAERPFYERSRMVLHVTRRLLLRLLASVLSSHVRFQILNSSYQFNLCR